jgi:type II secretory pathway pseudopilin PulG
MRFYRKAMGRGLFSLLEISLVVVVLGIVGTIVGPRMSRAGTSSPQVAEQVLVGRLRALRGAIHAYAQDHGGRYPNGDVSRITAELTQYSDGFGAVHPTPTSRYGLGPYLPEIPPLPVGKTQGAATLGLPGAARDAGWIYDPSSGQIRANLSAHDCDAHGQSYASY